MLFTTGTFVLIFLPIVLAGFFAIGRRSHVLASAWLFLASLVFYGYWMPEFTLLLLTSIGVNFAIGMRTLKARTQSMASAKRWLVLGIAFNLGLLGYFKYANFFVENLSTVLGVHLSIAKVILPIGVSFYCFTQIAFLVDTYQGKVKEARWVHYGLFVTYFPHLIAGPVLHHAQMMPQFADPAVYRFQPVHFVGGLVIFALGLFKKVILADGIAPYADAVFGPVDGGAVPGAQEAWLAACAYTFQIYFDFSGYSDMAVGLSWMFNIRLPFNFNSPYRAANISEFWRRWHITLSTFLRDYLYVPLGGNRRGEARRYFNLATTMLLGGLWHGASWAFVIWGALHGAYLTCHHAYRAVLGKSLIERLEASRLHRLLAWALTMLVVILAWVFFRAVTSEGALRMLQAMAGIDGASTPGLLLWNAGVHLGTGVIWCIALGAVAFLAPNSNDIGIQAMNKLRDFGKLRDVVAGAACAVVLGLVVINAARDSVSAFIYFNF